MAEAHGRGAADNVRIRRFGPADDVEALTGLLHRAYRRLADAGLRYVATHQTADVTRKRIEGGECYLAILDDAVAGTICYYSPESTSGCARYDRPEVASFGQFGVEPMLQCKGIGSALLTHIEARARESGAGELALDTSEKATHLIDWYERKGYRIVERVSWGEIVNYRSVVMSKPLI